MAVPLPHSTDQAGLPAGSVAMPEPR